jgi:hypothetical protein
MGIGPGSVPPITTVVLSTLQHWGELDYVGESQLPWVTRADFPSGMLLSRMNCDLARAVSSCTRVSRVYRIVRRKT